MIISRFNKAEGRPVSTMGTSPIWNHGPDAQISAFMKGRKMLIDDVEQLVRVDKCTSHAAIQIEKKSS